MRYKRFIEKPLKFIDKKSKYLELALFKQKQYDFDSPIFKFYYLGTSLLICICCLLTVIRLDNLDSQLLASILYLIPLVWIVGIYLFISDNGKYKYPEFSLNHRRLIMRKHIHTNLGLKLNKTQVRKLYDFFIAAEFIKSGTTSFGAFNTVLTKNFNHNQNIELNLYLSQIRCLFNVFKTHSKSFLALVEEHELFLGRNSKKINYSSLRNTTSTRNVKSADMDFQGHISKFENLLLTMAPKNDDK